MVKRFCDICGREIVHETVSSSKDPNNYLYGTIEIQLSIPISTGEHKISFDDTCHGCKKKLNAVTPETLKSYLKQIIQYQAAEEELPF